MDHGEWLYKEQVHVPLVLRYPPKIKQGSRISELVGLIDLMPSILDLLDLSPGHSTTTGKELDWRSFLPLLLGEPLPPLPIFIKSKNCSSDETTKH